MIRELVLRTAKLVASQYRFGESVLSARLRAFDHRKACKRPVEIWRMGFDCIKACSRPVEVWRVLF